MANTIEQKRAKFAFDSVKGFYDRNNEKTRKEYRSHVKKIPMLIKTNGIGATYSFALAKGGVWENLYKLTEDWLKEEPKGLIKDKFTGNIGLAEVLITLNSPLYRAITVEVMALFEWMRRFAEGLLEDNQQGGN